MLFFFSVLLLLIDWELESLFLDFDSNGKKSADVYFVDDDSGVSHNRR